MAWDWLFPLLGGVGLGSLLNTALQSYFKRNAQFTQRVFQEKKKAYLEVLAALGDVAAKGSVESKMRFAVAVERATLVGSPDVVRLARGLRTTAANSTDRNKTQDELLIAMRDDLGLDARSVEKSLDVMK